MILKNSGYHIKKYRQDLLKTQRYEDQEQAWLKNRVLKTYRQLLSMFASEDHIQGSFLDTGSADKAFEKICIKNDIQCDSIDIDKGVDFEKDPLPFQDKSYRYVNSNSVIEHLRDPGTYLTEIHRVLEEGGYLIIVTPHWPYAYKTFFDSFTHYHPYSYKSLNKLLRAYQFETLASVPWLVNKSRLYWKIPPPLSFWVAKNCLLFPGTVRWAPPFLKGKTNALLSLARRR